jgi:Tetratricopeptide repeat
LLQLGEVGVARDLGADTLARLRRVLGDDHAQTMASALNLASDLRRLGEVEAARDLDADTLARLRRVLGDDHPRTLTSASNLAADLERLGDHHAAAALRAEVRHRRSDQDEAAPDIGP